MDGTGKGLAPPFQEEVALDGVELAQGKQPASAAPASWDSPEEQSIVHLTRGSRKISGIQVSVILPIYNAECWLDECLKSLLEQDFQGSIELSVFNDASTDNSINIIEKWKVLLEEVDIQVCVGGHCSPQPRGVGFAKNCAVGQSSGAYLCFLDSIVGCQVKREPAEATERYTRWINSLTNEQLVTQVFTSHGPTVIMPTWFCSREWFCHVGKFDEGGKGIPEDLLYFYEHLRKGGEVFRVDQCLLLYRYHPQAATHSVLEETIWTHRLLFLEERILSCWISFTIWNAGKQGRKFFRSLSPTNQKKVTAFCDVDQKKITKGFYTYEDSKETPKPRIPIIHFRDASPPFIICVKLDLTGGQFEENLSQLNLKEGVDYHHFN
ncbi:queuosine-tRNA galactosyltransferase isoform X2 [Paroedura picta]|uniref:queuosine-tRNA galactosyltransferase isoform X2 n=1 Tax=Paroedura picta TaxID=143630 RepID=UPI004056AB1B